MYLGRIELPRDEQIYADTDPQRRREPQKATNEKVTDADRAREIKLGDEQPCYQEAAKDKKNVDPDETAANTARMKEDHQGDRDSPEAIERWNVLHEIRP